MKPLPCPCCGNKNLYTGHLSSTVMGVQCLPEWEAGSGCGLSLGIHFEQISFIKGKSYKHHFNRLLKEAISRWNKRQ